MKIETDYIISINLTRENDLEKRQQFYAFLDDWKTDPNLSLLDKYLYWDYEKIRFTTSSKTISEIVSLDEKYKEKPVISSDSFISKFFKDRTTSESFFNDDNPKLEIPELQESQVIDTRDKVIEDYEIGLNKKPYESKNEVQIWKDRYFALLKVLNTFEDK